MKVEDRRWKDAWVVRKETREEGKGSDLCGSGVSLTPHSAGEL